MTDRTIVEPIGDTSAMAVSAAAAVSRVSRVRVLVAIALFEFRMAARGRWTIASAVAFAGAALAISYFGLFGAGYLEFQGFERTAVSLLSLVVFLAPLLGLVLGVGGFASPEMLDLLFAQPSGRAPVVLGKLAGLTLAIAAAVAAGLGLAGLVVASQVGADGVGGYVALVAASVVLGGIFVGVAAVSGLAFRDRLQASGAAIGVWVWFVFLGDLVLLGALLLVPEVSVRPLVVAATFCSPVTLARVLVLLSLGAESVLGSSGALLLRTFGTTGTFVALATGLTAWLVTTWLAAAAIASRRDA